MSWGTYQGHTAPVTLGRAPYIARVVVAPTKKPEGRRG